MNDYRKDDLDKFWDASFFYEPLNVVGSVFEKIVPDEEPEIYGKWAFINGGSHRPAWEDVILNRIDRQRYAVTQRKLQLERNTRGPSEKEKAETAEAATLRAFRARAHQRGVEAATRLGSRYTDSIGQPSIHSWHAPRTPEGLPEGVTIEEEENVEAASSTRTAAT